jgi:hypothetical protein
VGAKTMSILHVLPNNNEDYQKEVRRNEFADGVDNFNKNTDITNDPKFKRMVELTKEKIQVFIPEV